MQPKIMLFIPVFNCEKQIPRVLKKIDSDTQSKLSEIVVVNNLSTDNTEIVAKNELSKIRGCSVTLLRNKENYGLGGSHKVAFSYARQKNFDYCLVIHGDDQGDLGELMELIRIDEHLKFDCLLNSRFMVNSRRIGYSKFRTFGNIIFNILFSIASRRIQWDLGSGLCCYSSSFLNSGVTELCSDDLTFNYTLQLQTASRPFSQKFFPSSWTEDDQISNVKLIGQAWKMTKILFSYVMDRDKFLKTSRGNSFFSYEADIIYHFKI